MPRHMRRQCCNCVSARKMPEGKHDTGRNKGNSNAPKSHNVYEGSGVHGAGAGARGVYSEANFLRSKPNSLLRSGPVAGLLCVVEEDFTTPTLQDLISCRVCVLLCCPPRRRVVTVVVVMV